MGEKDGSDVGLLSRVDDPTSGGGNKERIQGGSGLSDNKPPSFYLINSVHMSVSFFLVFTAFSGIQNIETSFIKVKNVGFITIGLLYLIFTISCLATPAIVDAIGPRWSMASAFLFFCLFCVANVVVVHAPDSAALAWGALLPTASLTGFAASFLWTAQGAYLTACAIHYARGRDEDSKSALGFFNGLFFCIFQLTQISGNLLESFVYKKGHPTPLFIVYLSCAAVGLIASVFLRTVRPVSSDDAVDGEASQAPIKAQTSGSSLHVGEGEDNGSAKPARTGAVELLLKTLRMWKDIRMLLLIPLMLVSGLEQGWVWGNFTSDYVKPALGKANIGFVMACFGATDALMSVVLGKVSDKIGRGPVLVLGFLCQLAVSIGLLIINVKHGDWALLIVCAVLWAVGDATWNTQITALLGDLFDDNIEAAFANFKLWQSLMTAIAFGLGDVLVNEAKLILLLVLLSLGIACGLMLLCKTRADKKRKEDSAV